MSDLLVAEKKRTTVFCKIWPELLMVSRAKGRRLGKDVFLFDLGKTVSANRISEESIPNVLDEK